MSHIRTKITYEVTADPWGTKEPRTLYCHKHNTVDITTFYDQDGKYLFSYEDTEHPNLYDAIKMLVETGYPEEMKPDPKFKTKVEWMNEEDCKKCDI